MEWSVRIEHEAPVDATVSDEAIYSGIGEMLDALVHYGAVPAGDHRGWSVQLTVDADSFRHAFAKAGELVSTWARKVGLPDWPVCRVEIVRADVQDQELARPNFPELLGSQEVTQLLDISRQRLHELRTQGRFPQPITELASGPVWLRPAIDAYLERWDRTPGRPRRPQD